MKTREFQVRKGPIFAEIVLIDEINRMHPKSQSAFLEAMEEKHVSIAGNRYQLPEIHMVLATQNPIEYSGTYPLPEAQRDRFACMVSMGFPSTEVQTDILRHQKYNNLDQQIADLPQILTQEDIVFLRNSVQSVKISDEILNRLISLAEWTRNPEEFRYGLSPRSLSVFAAAMRANAVLEGRAYVIPEDGYILARPCVRHRVEHLNPSLADEKLGEVIEQKYKELFRGL